MEKRSDTLIIIPAYNEAENIERVIDGLVQGYPQYDYLLVNDGSCDDTEAICLRNGYNFISHPVNLGLAGAFQSGMRYAKKHAYDRALQFDGDGQHDPAYIEDMIRALQDGYDIVIGSRFVTEKKPRTLRMFGSRLIGAAIKLTTGRTIRDPTSGMRLYNRRMIGKLASGTDLGPEPDTVALMLRKGMKVGEVQVRMDERAGGKSYLNLSASILYMLKMFISILILQWFRGGC